MTGRRSRPGVVVVVALLLAGCGGAGDRTPAPPPIAAHSGLTVTLSARTFVDSTRPTRAQGDVPERPTRTLVTTIAVPEGPGPFPLVMFSHGFGGSGERYSDLLRAMASAGYVVAAPDFPLTSTGAPGGPQRGAEAPDAQPGDVRFVIDQLLRLNADPADPLAGRIAPERIGAAGHSMGAGVTMGVAFNSCCRDARIRAGVLMSVDPPTAYLGDYFVPPSVPALFIHGDQDESLPYPAGRRAYAKAEPPKFLLTVLGGDHNWPFTGASSPPGAGVVLAVTIDFFDAYLKGRPDGLRRLEADSDRAGVTTLERVIG